MSVQQADGLARIALGHVTQEFPNKLDHVLTAATDAAGPRELHPVFYGSFDWHSCVHSYWLLASLYHRFPALPSGPAIRRLFDTHLTPTLIAGECMYLDRPSAAGFERPYGWAWLLKLSCELGRQPSQEAQTWMLALQPLADRFVDRFLTYLPRATYPIRAGVHTNTAFALRLALDYPHPGLRTALLEAARRWYLNDSDCQAWEPSGDDFLSPSLMEAECMRVVLPDTSFRAWFSKFLPRLDQRLPHALFTPVSVSDRTDGKIAHLDGLNLSRAWCWRSLAPFAPDPVAIEAVAQAHIDVSLPHVGGHYMGSHWLASFAALALEPSW